MKKVAQSGIVITVKFRIRFLSRRKRWQLDYFNGRRVRAIFKTKAFAEAEVERVRGDIERAGAVWVQMGKTERNELMSVAAEIKTAGHTPRFVWDEFKKGRQAAPSASPAADVALREMIDGKRKAKRNGEYLGNLNQIVGAFIKGREQLPMAAFNDVEKFIDGYNLSYRPTVRARLSTWFKFGIRRGYISADPCERMEAIILPPKIPPTLTVEQTKNALEWLKTHPRALAWFLLTTFAGLRPDEARKTPKAMLNFTENWVRVEAQTTKVRERRVVYPKQGVMASIQKALNNDSELPLTEKQLQMERKELRAVLGFDTWPQDITRHTAASNWLAVESSKRVADNLGHSERILHTRYKALKTKVEASEFWGLLSNKKSEKVKA
ncbi:MAG: hypothetical protein KGL39_50875 [Patescibacteria group bacterium]|nr:hypothetical protein [Patescibacteria group bacterium]